MFYSPSHRRCWHVYRNRLQHNRPIYPAKPFRPTPIPGRNKQHRHRYQPKSFSHNFCLPSLPFVLWMEARVDLPRLRLFQVSQLLAQLFKQQRRYVKQIMSPHWPRVSPRIFAIGVPYLHLIKPRNHRLAILVRNVFLASNTNPEKF